MKSQEEAGPSWSREPEGDRTIEENWLFRLRRERSRSRATGKAHDYYVVHLADAVEVVAITAGREIVLVRQFRAGSGADSLEPPGGLVEPGEDVLAAGVRELLEETGYAGNAPRVLGRSWANPSLLTSRMTTILVTDAVKVAAPKLDVGEEVAVELVPASEILTMIGDGRIGHALAVEGLLRWYVAEEVGRREVCPPFPLPSR
ncbi:NUDIX hydrolase [Isosphaeraceae bacterium EP7]